MIRNNALRITISVCLFLLSAVPVLAQATFSVASSATIGANIGVTELTGLITLTIVSGTSVAAPLSIRYSAPITNTSMQEVQVWGTSGLAKVAGHPTLDSVNNGIIINVPAGGASGSRIVIEGLRVAVAGSDGTSVTALLTDLTARGNAIVTGQSRVTVIDHFLTPFAVDLSNMVPLEWRNGIAVNPGTNFLVKEIYEAAFTDAVGYYGQTVGTRVRIHPFPTIPEGVKLKFGSEAASTQTGAVLRTLSGGPETVPKADGSTDVVYEFSSMPLSSQTIETFRVFVGIEVSPTAGSGSITFQGTLEPIGIAKPDKTYPSTDIPRFWKLTLPPEEDLLTGTTELIYPFSASREATFTGIAVTNPLPYRTRITLTAYDLNGLLISGKGITNPYSTVLPGNGQLAKLATEIFGPALNASSGGTIRLVGNTSVLAGFYLQGKETGSGLDGATAELSAKFKLTCPNVFRRAPSPYTVLELFNPDTAAASATLNLYDSAGKKIATSSQKLARGGSAFQDLRVLFAGTDPDSFSGGYVTVSSDVPIMVRETFGNLLDFNVLPAQVPIQKTLFYFAHFASGGGYETELTLVNTGSAIGASATLTLMEANGSPFAVTGNPVRVSIPPGTQMIRTVADLFPGLPTALRTGYIRVDVDPVSVGPFTSAPALAGSLRFSSGGGYGSATLPLTIPAMSEFVYSHVAQSLGYFTGVAILNANSETATVGIEVYEENGELAGSFETRLRSGQKISKLLYELVPESEGQLRGHIRIKSDRPVTSFSLFGSDDGLLLSAIPPQSVEP